MDLASLGFTPPDQLAFDALHGPTLTPCRVSEQHRGAYRLLTPDGELQARPSGRLRRAGEGGAALPAVGDWVAARVRADEGSATIAAVLPRRTVLVRGRAEGESSPQVIAANLDTVFVVCSLNRDFNLRRIERYLSLVWDSGARPVVLLTKADLCTDAQQYAQRTREVAWGVNVHAVSALEGTGVQALGPYLRSGQTVALVGSSGAGKSTLLNALCGQEVMATGEIREDDQRGRHTTSHRELVVLPGGGLLIDTPGMREVGLWDGADGVRTTFEDIEAFAADCRFADCTHGSEPGCAVAQAVERGQLQAGRLGSYHKLQRELAHQERRVDERARLAHQQELRRVFKERKKSLRTLYKNR